MMLYSNKVGNIHKDHFQYNTILYFQSSYGNQIRDSPHATLETFVFLDEKGMYKSLVGQCGFTDFLKDAIREGDKIGCQIWLQD